MICAVSISSVQTSSYSLSGLYNEMSISSALSDIVISQPVGRCSATS